MKSRILTLILAGVMSISLLSCGGTAKTPDPSASAPWYRVPLRCDYRCYIIIKPGREGKVVDSLDIM